MGNYLEIFWCFILKSPVFEDALAFLDLDGTSDLLNQTIVFLSDPGVPGVRSMGPVVSH